MQMTEILYPPLQQSQRRDLSNILHLHLQGRCILGMDVHSTFGSKDDRSSGGPVDKFTNLV